METRKFHTLDEAITEAGLPTLFQEPVAEHWEDGGSLRVSFHDDVWWILNHPIWSETDATLCCAEQRIEFMLQFDDDRTVVSTMYVAVLREFTTKRVTVQDRTVYVCAAQYDVHRWVYGE